MRLLVTGGAGYIGSVVTAQLLTAGHQVIVVDDLSTGHANAVPPRARFHRAGIDELEDVMGDWALDAVLHFAARSLVGESVADPAAYWQNNVGATLGLLEAMRINDVPRIVFSSTAATYGDRTEMPITEAVTPAPTNPYGATKLAIDLALTNYTKAYGLTAVSLRYFNVAGALHESGGASYGERHGTETHLIPLALRAAAGRSGPLRLFGCDYPTPDGTCVRDYVHVADLADAHIRALAFGSPGEHHIINLGSGLGYSVREVLEAVEEATARPVPVEQAPRRDGDPATLIASNERAATLLGWHPDRGLHQMVSDAWRFEQRFEQRLDLR